MFDKQINKDFIVNLFKEYNLYDIIVKYEKYYWNQRDIVEDTGHALISILFDICATKDFRYNNISPIDEIHSDPDSFKISCAIDRFCYMFFSRNILQRSYSSEIVKTLINNLILEEYQDDEIVKSKLSASYELLLSDPSTFDKSILENYKNDIRITNNGVNFLYKLINIFQAEKIILKTIIEKTKSNFRWNDAYCTVYENLNKNEYYNLDKISIYLDVLKDYIETPLFML